MREVLFLMLVAMSSILFAQTGCPEVDAGPDVTLDCATGLTTTLSATFLDLGETDQYTVESIPYAPPFPFDAGSPANITIDDRWSQIITLPFEFCFFENTYTQLLVGANGQITFELDSPNGFCPWDLASGGGDPYTIPGTEIDIVNAIFGAAHDMDISIDNLGSFSFGVIGDAPCRAFVVNYNNLPHFGGACDGFRTTQQIVLYENTNAIDVYIENKPSCSGWNEGYAVIGIMNEDATVAFTPPGRNTSAWEATDEAWRFLPSGDPVYEFTWLDDMGNVLSTDPDFQITPSETATYTAEITYTNCTGEEIVDMDEVTVTVEDTDIDVEPADDFVECDDDDDGVLTFDLTPRLSQINHTSDPDLVLNFHTDPDDAAMGVNPIADPANFSNTSNPQTIYVSVLNPANSCIVVVDFELIINQEADVNTISNYILCEEGTTGTATFDLDSRIELIRTNPTDIITFHIDMADAISGADPLPSSYVNISNPQTIYVRADNGTGCFTDMPLTFDLVVSEQPEVLAGGLIEECSTNTTADFDLSMLDTQVTSETGVTITYHPSETEAEAGTGAISSPFNTATTTVWARIETADGCASTVEADLTVNTGPGVQPDNEESCETVAGSGEAIFDLDAILADIQAANPGIDLSIHNTEAEAESGANPLSGTITTVPITLWLNSFENVGALCVSVRSFELQVLLKPVVNTITNQEECDDDNDGAFPFDLAALIDQIRTDASHTVTFHTSEMDAESGDNPLGATFTNTMNPQTIYVRVENGTDCFDPPTSFDLEVIASPTVINGGALEECSENTTADFDLLLLDPQVTTETGVTITYHPSEAEAEAGSGALTSPFNSATTTVWARVETTEGCANTVEADLTVTNGPGIQPDNVETCETIAESGEGVFDLDAVLADIQAANPGINLSIHETQADAQTGTNPMSGMLTTIPTVLWLNSSESVGLQCPSVRSFELQVLLKPIVNTISPQQECDDDSDGAFPFDLAGLVDDIRTDVSHTVTFHTSMMDATTGDNPLGATFTNTSNPQTIFVRVDNGTGCFDPPTSFDLEVIASPSVLSGATLGSCSQETSADFNLASLDPQVTSETGVTVTYHATEAEAEAGTGVLTSPFSSGSTTIWARVENTLGCFSTVSAALEVTTAPGLQPDNLIECETIAESGEAIFDIDALLAALQAANPGITISVHDNPTDAESGASPITGTLTSAPRTLWLNSFEDIAPTCTSIRSFELQILQKPVVNTITAQRECDDDDDEVFAFDLVGLVNDIRNDASHTVTFHTSMMDATTGDNPLGASFSNTSNPQTIFVRVDNGTGCFDPPTSFDLVVLPKPSVLDGAFIEVCSDVNTSDFDLAQLDSQVSPTTTDVTITYHNSEREAEAGANPLSAMTNSRSATIWARIENANGCFNTTPAELIVNLNLFETVDAIFCIQEGYQLPDGQVVFETGSYTTVLPLPTGCERTITSNLTEGTIVFPTAFTPNRNGFNDFFRPSPNQECSVTVQDYDLKVWNRWGELVFQTNSFTEGWNGEHGGLKAQAGTYVYRSTYSFEGQATEKQGILHLID